MKVRDDTFIEWDSFPPHGGRGLGAVNLIKNKHYINIEKLFWQGGDHNNIDKEYNFTKQQSEEVSPCLNTN